MAANFPTSLPDAGSATTTATLAAAGHTALHNNVNDEARALGTKIGTGSSTPSANTFLRGSAAGVSAWAAPDLSTADVSGTLPVSKGGTGVTTSTGTGSVVLSSSPTITTPTIASFTNATHDHSNAAGGGSLGAITATSLTTNTISASGANHIVLSAGTSKLVKTTVLRQDDTTNTYQVGNSVTLTGWGVITPGAASQALETITFGVTFTQRPIVIAIYGGDEAASTTYGAATQASGIKLAMIRAYEITTTSFKVAINTSDGTNWSAGNTVFYQWTAIGEI